MNNTPSRPFAKLKQMIWPYLPAPYKARRIIWAPPPSYPRHVFIEPSTRCNLKCVHCGRTYWKERAKGRDIDFDLVKKLLDEFAELGVKEVTLQGLGEPLLHANIFDMITYARGLGFYTRFNTNLTILSGETAELLVQCGHSEVMVSIESVDPDLFADIRRGTTLDTVLGNVEKLAEIKNRLGKNLPAIYVSAVLFKSTLPQIPAFISKMKSLGIARINFQGFNTEGIDLNTRLRDGTPLGNETLSDMPPDEIEKLVAEIKSYGDDDTEVSVCGDLGGRGSRHKPSKGIVTCRELWETSNIDSSGHVTPCCWLPDATIIDLGDLKKKSFSEIWFGNAYDRLRRQHLRGKLPAPCQGCQALTYVVAHPSRFFGKPEDFPLYTGCFLKKTTP